MELAIGIGLAYVGLMICFGASEIAKAIRELKGK